jgi:hypothetical protein
MMATAGAKREDLEQLLGVLINDQRGGNPPVIRLRSARCKRRSRRRREDRNLSGRQTVRDKDLPTTPVAGRFSDTEKPMCYWLLAGGAAILTS